MTDTPGWSSPAEPGDGWQAPTPEGAPGGPPAGVPGQPPGYGPPPGSYGQPAYGQGGYGQPGQWGGQPGWGNPNSPWGAPPASKPGVIPLRPLSVGEILDGAFSVIRHYPRVTLGLSAIVVTVSQVVNFALNAGSLFSDEVADDSFSAGSSALPAAGAVLGWVVTGIASVILAGMLTSVMGEAVLGREATIGETWRRVRPRFWALVGASILGGVVPVLALVLCIAPGVFLWGAWALMTPALILERIGVMASIRRSWRLAVPDWWRVWGIRALATLIAGALGAIIAFPVGAAIGITTFSAQSPDAGFGVLAVVLLTLAQIVAGTITAPFTSGVLALLYIDRRMRAEGLDVTLAQAASGASSGQAAAP